MAQRQEAFTYAIPALTSQLKHPGASMDAGTVTGLSVVFPPGVHGNLGVLIFYSGAQVVPKTSGFNLKGNHERFDFDLDDYPTGQGWDIAVTNSDVIAHSFTTLFHIDELEDATVNIPALIFMPID